ncbi:MAG: S41 family peptidase [Bryobacteraceae bacterium]
MSSRIKYLVVSSSSCLTLLLLIGSVMSKGASTDDHYKYVGVFSDVVAKIKNDYVEDPDMKSVTLGALNGMLEAIDPFASYLNAEQYKEYLKNKDAKRADLGLLLSKKAGFVGVVGVVPNSPAAKAGLSTFDMIESIKGIATRDMPLAYASMLMQGEAGSTVELSVWRYRRAEPQTVKLTRAMLTLPPVDSKMLAGEVGYINIDALSAAHVKEVAAAVESLEKQGARKLMVDVRDCAMGGPEDGVALANLFVKQGRITYMQGQRVPRQNFDADSSKAITSLPLVVLTNRGTAGAAEILAAAVKDNKRGDVVGERTYGDAALRKAINMDDGGAIILSVAKYYGADGKAIQDTGVLPGTVVQEADSQVDYDDNGEPIPDTVDQQQQKQKKLEDDPVVKKGLEILAKA